MPGLLDARVAAVTGAGTGLGEAIARRLAEHGARVVVGELDAARGARVAAEIGGTAIACDVSKEADVAALFAAVDRDYGRLDVLVNNAAVNGPTNASEDFDLVAFQATYAVNVAGIMLCLKYAVPMLKRRGGSVINLSSLSGYKPFAFRAVYGSSKFAVRGITESVAQELGPFAIRVNSICPGGTETEMFRRANAERARREGLTFDAVIARDYVDKSALRLVLQPDNIADAALFLASDLSKTITGAHLRVDAGVQ